MSAQILNGKALSLQKLSIIQKKVAQRLASGLTRPGLAVVLVGQNPASAIYVRNKRKRCEEAGFISKSYDLPSDTTESVLLELIYELNHDEAIHGILVQLPLPKQINEAAIIEAIFPHKDVDGFHPYNLGRLAQARPLLRPCTPMGVMSLLETTQHDLTGKKAVIVGASNIVGRPMALELLMAKCTVTICHSKTQHLSDEVKQADILISATGCHGLINSEWIKAGAIAIDVGINRNDAGQLVGDLIFDTAAKRCSWITPVPGGVGPMTIVSLLENTLQAAELPKNEW